MQVCKRREPFKESLEPHVGPNELARSEVVVRLMNEICAGRMMSYGPCLSLYFARKVLCYETDDSLGLTSMLSEC